MRLKDTEFAAVKLPRCLVCLFIFWFGVESTHLACRVHPKRAQMEPYGGAVQGTPGDFLARRHSRNIILK